MTTTTTHYVVKSAAHNSYLWASNPEDYPDWSWEHLNNATLFDSLQEAQYAALKVPYKTIIGTVDVTMSDWKADV